MARRSGAIDETARHMAEERAKEADSPREDEVMTMEEEEATRATVTSQRASIFARAASMASRAGRVIAMPRAKSKVIEETESEASPLSEVREDDMDEPLGATTEELAPALPWQTRDENGDPVDDQEIRHKILELTVFRSSFVEHPGGEEEYLFDFVDYKEIAKELLLCDPSLREMHTLLVPATLNEAVFWRNFFLRCNSLRVENGRSPYLQEAKATYSRLSTLASLQKFKRELAIRRRSSTDRLRRSIMMPRGRASTDTTTDALEVDLGDLDLDLDGEIDKELRKRRPSRAVQYHGSASYAPGA